MNPDQITYRGIIDKKKKKKEVQEQDTGGL